MPTCKRQDFRSALLIREPSNSFIAGLNRLLPYRARMMRSSIPVILSNFSAAEMTAHAMQLFTSHLRCSPILTKICIPIRLLISSPGNWPHWASAYPLFLKSTLGCHWRHRIQTRCGWLTPTSILRATRLVCICNTPISIKGKGGRAKPFVPAMPDVPASWTTFWKT